MADPSHPAHPAGFGMLRTIALYKLVKVVILLLAAYGEVRLHDATLTARILSWAAGRPHGLEHDLVTHALSWFSGLSESRVHALRFVTLTYAAVFAVEGIGLWLQRRWAEWLTTIITASLIPLEVWELIHNPSLGAALVLLANMLIVGYLYWHVSTHRKAALPPP
ncbi:MAG TPA: DUF2127 domain-containing protein [Steroidobacteraceae bacterium]|nr:DUF2127 domain-containing protein [Steroidobacteraceae bacterium]